jgi:hypothetical protein
VSGVWCQVPGKAKSRKTKLENGNWKFGAQERFGCQVSGARNACWVNSQAAIAQDQEPSLHNPGPKTLNPAPYATMCMKNNDLGEI